MEGQRPSGCTDPDRPGFFYDTFSAIRDTNRFLRPERRRTLALMNSHLIKRDVHRLDVRAAAFTVKALKWQPVAPINVSKAATASSSSLKE